MSNDVLLRLYLLQKSCSSACLRQVWTPEVTSWTNAPVVRVRVPEWEYLVHSSVTG